LEVGKVEKVEKVEMVVDMMEGASLAGPSLESCWELLDLPPAVLAL